jgi:GMP synthase (glutamine-hydrolysing)
MRRRILAETVRRAGESQVLLVDFDGVFTMPTKHALEAAHARVKIELNEDLTAEHIQRRSQTLALVLPACELGTFYTVHPAVFSSGLPVLGICNGAQLLAQHAGGSVYRMLEPEEGTVRLAITATSPLTKGLPRELGVYMHHEYGIADLPNTAKVTATTENSPIAAFEMTTQGAPMFGLQFHPESLETEFGVRVLKRFLRVSRIYQSGGVQRDCDPP